MTPPQLAAVVMAGGLGTRMKSSRPKHVHPLLGRRLIDWIVGAVLPLRASPVVVVVSPETEGDLAGTLGDGVQTAVQQHPLGTGDAVASARAPLAGFEGDLLVVAGDTPLLREEVLGRLVDEHRQRRAAVTVLSFEPPDPRSYGRVIRDASGGVEAIVEAADATPDQLAVREANSSIYVFSLPLMWSALERLEARNAQGELYLTDAVRNLVSDGHPTAVYRAPDPADVEGVNTRVELAEAAAVLRDRIVRAHMLAGVTIVDPATTWIEPDVAIEPDAVIHPFTVLRGNTVVHGRAEVGPHVVADGAEVGSGALVGPFCYLRPGTRLAERAKAGTFVEIKNSAIGAGTKVPHLSYIGDADVGAETNIGAGAITANYRAELGGGKHRTVIGSGVHTGSQNVFVPPVEIGDGAWTGAGSAITEDVPPDALAIARARQVNKEGYRGRDRRD